MRAIHIARPGPPEVLQLVERPVPVAGPKEVLIRVEAAGVNRPDVLQRLGKYPVPPGASELPGLEVAGTIVASHDPAWKVGDAVCALVQGGGYAEFCIAPGAQCLPIPSGLSWVAAASLPETFFTVWSNVFDRAHLGQREDGEHETLLVQGGTSGIGVTAIQLAKALGHPVFATAGTPEKARACETLGAQRGIDYRREDFVSV
ncbi:MAG TPA: zinc-binding dehydrogenase, partial [Burkholderiaceae bacterium]|nr:zinc-binding dehydrogenase [Burkholderiaceae bacterium]